MGDLGVGSSLVSALNLNLIGVDLIADNVGDILFYVLDSQIAFPSNFLIDLDLPSKSQMEQFLTELEAYDPTNQLINVARIFFDKLILLDTTGGLQLCQTSGQVALAMSLLTIALGIAGVVIAFVEDGLSILKKPGNIASIVGLATTIVSLVVGWPSAGSDFLNWWLTFTIAIAGLGFATAAFDYSGNPVLLWLGLISTIVGIIANIVLYTEKL